MGPKRKASSPVRPSPSKKRAEPEDGHYEHSRVEERVGIVQREFYPPELSNERCEQYNNGEIPRPIEVLRDTLDDTRKKREQIAVDKCVVHWFKRDLRLNDNRGLRMASEMARKNKVPLVCMFLVSPEDYQAHVTSPARVDFELRTVHVLQQDLEQMDIPLYTATIDKRENVPNHIVDKCSEWGAKHVFCNIEYEVDELRRETKLINACLAKGIAFTPVHDDVVVAPGELKSGSGKQYSVYSPWLRTWIKHIHDHPHLLNESNAPDRNDKSAREQFKTVFAMKIPSAPKNKSLSEEAKQRYGQMWPAGEHEAKDRLDRFLKEKIKRYKDARNYPADNSTSILSLHFSSGTLAARTAVRAARDANSTKKLDGGNGGITCWISELAWRDFYKHILAHWPYVCMSKPFKYEYADIEWEYDDELWKCWCDGRTGFPIVDAAMRQLNHTGYMHNRCRMIVASFLSKDLLMDWRMGEKYFMEHLIDGDFASNNGGWGFSASTGVDPQPYFRIFNPTLQSERFDDNGEYIRKWVPELAKIEGKPIHDPYNRGKEKQAREAGYPKPIVEHSKSRERALDRYKNGLGRDTANVGGGVHN